jgi:23S rRNA (cytosine1962-C5)-methyltransferase
VLGLPETAISLKHRERQKGLQQYEKTGSNGEDFITQENGLKFIVNLDAYLDTGLFLDHRITRAMVRDIAQDKRFLNLFAYTGSFTVYAAAGGATRTTTVDLSNTYQNWTQRNFELNQMNLSKHELVRADVFAYLDQAIANKEKFDLIVMDPPSFSNSKKMQGVLDVQRDHAKLIRQAFSLLTAGGKLFFSNNLRSFALDESLLSEMKIIDITTKTIPEDFRDKKIHRCYLISE